jgi:organic hydroperoxide reductase OsmC/OhrA
MSIHTASVTWRRATPAFTYESYDRGHRWTFGSGTSIDASAAADFRGDAAKVNPEEAFVAALSSCHMLTFLAIAARKRLVVDAYDDDAEGHLEKNAEGRLAVTRVTLRPRVRFAPDTTVDDAELADLHAKAHENCFIAQSVRTDVRVEPVQAD